MEKESIQKDPFFKKVDKFISTNHLIARNDRILCAVSGGPDSIALLHILFTLIDKYNIKLFVAHLEHGIRGKESIRDQKFVENICKKLGIPFYTKNVRVKEEKKSRESIEETARRVRLDFLHEQSRVLKCNKIAIGHTLDDHIETIIFRLVSGTGQRGIKGIQISANGIIRPLLGFNKKEIITFLQRNSIRYMEDKTNYDVNYMRNRIRYRIIPEIEKINSRYRDHINNFVELVSEDDLFIEEMLDDYLKKAIKKVDESEFRISFNPFYDYHPAIKKRIILRVLDYLYKFNTNDNTYLSYKTIKAITENIPASNKKLYSDKHVTILSEYKELVFKKTVVENINTEYLYNVDSDISEIFIKEIGKKILLEITEKDRIDKFHFDKLYFDYDKVKYPLVVRSRKPGDKINLPNLGFKKIKSIFINDKVKPLDRSRIPIILIEGKIAGIFCSYYGKTNRVSKDFMVDKSTKRVLVCKIV